MSKPEYEVVNVGVCVATMAAMIAYGPLMQINSTEDIHMSMKKHVNFAITKLSFSFRSSRVTPYGGLLVPGQMLSAIDFDRKVDRYTPPAKEYSNSDILKSMLIGILCGNADFEAIHQYETPSVRSNHAPADG